jgi:hypothetical protein
VAPFRIVLRVHTQKRVVTNQCTQCFNVGTGGNQLAFPKNMAMKLGKDDGWKALYLQIHYNNPEGDNNATDSSGFTAYMTSKPREIECALLAYIIDAEKTPLHPS